MLGYYFSVQYKGQVYVTQNALELKLSPDVTLA